ncbi:DUF4185 domain-containing protein [Corynebacterium silvaticum]|uniref:DUF4185 domain-containing protein n=1 Tax=Corynebacterium silvaticum TaxID=2320431 RepID=A0A7Y4LKE1_9CORY|nr:DUF4185 domain-containing protein [Corynebacterium silvaticum]ARU45376.1 DUF4185 domain-containing protein [Corynebacterium silvaticum]MBH5299946.1 DUF4185 domain-containing protein [Corynebacterium silvaticum]NOM65530.1 DUF4185 domain-containing protein [Corynebacterium silvaticum]NON70688.1 DUF4185 domain-containing protein [Corynebacterium silvaticum]TFA92275.1 DUF4185 domain-containing protein [Corynebacterium silvaticum]
MSMTCRKALTVAALITVSSFTSVSTGHAIDFGKITRLPSALFSGSSGSSGSSVPDAKPAPQRPNRISEGLTVTMLDDLFGRGKSDKFGILSGDLGEMVRLAKDGKEFAIIFGDSFTGERLQGEWKSPIGVVAKLGEDGKIQILRPLNEGDKAEQLIEYEHKDRLTLLPSDVINIDGTIYMQAMWHKGLGNVISTQIWKSTDLGKTWSSVNEIPASYMNEFGSLLSWENGDDGYVYMVSSKFGRAHSVYLTRFRPDQISDEQQWEHYDPTTSTWSTHTEGAPLTPILSNSVKAGEMSLRRIEGHWVLSMFNEETWAIEVRISEKIDQSWDDIKPAHVVVAGTGGWGAKQSENNFTQLYGGYITPFSTLADMNIVVSQWNTSNNSRYNSTQFNVKGLDKFFNVTPKLADAQPTPRAVTASPEGTADQSVIEVSEVTPVDPGKAATPEHEILESVAPVEVLPLTGAHDSEKN